MPWISRTEEGGVRVFFHPATQEIISISSEAAFIYDNLIAGLSVESVARKIAEEYDVQKDDVICDVESTRKNLLVAGLLSDSQLQQSQVLEKRDIVRNPLAGYEVPKAPFRLFLTLTRTCNLTCSHCYNSSSPTVRESLEFEQVARLIDEAHRIGVFEIILSGGEPFLYPQLAQILKHAESRVSISIVTNGTLIERNLDLLKSNPPSRLQISIDGDAAGHDAIRGKGGYKKAIRGASLARELVPTSIGYTVTDSTNMDSIERLCADLQSHGITTLNINRLLKSGRASQLMSTSIDPESIQSLAESYDITCNIEDEAGAGSGLFHCGAGISIMSVKSDGSVFPCSYLQMCESQSIGSIHSSSLDQLWNNASMQAFREMNRNFKAPSACVCDAIIETE